MKVFLYSFLAFLLAGVLALTAIIKVVGRDLPSPARLQAISPAVKTKVLDRDGRLIGEFYRENRTLVRLDDVPDDLVNAFISVEDRRFWEHWGVNLPSVLRSSLRNFFSLRVREGASTITQQLARNLFLTQEKTLSRKIKEAVLAVRIEQNYSKREILEMYLNEIYFGDSAYGVQAAARRYFGKDVRDLTLAESALLAGVVRNPLGYSPRRHPEAAKRRRALVLRSMEDCGYITEARMRAALEDSISVTAAPLNPENAPYFMEMVRQVLDAEFGSEAVYEGGLVVHTTLDLPLQQEAERILEDHITKLEDSLQPKMSRAGYLLRKERGDNPSTEYIQGAAMVLDAGTGAIRILIGGRSFEESNFNRAVMAMRQPGSAFKPFIYLAAIESGFYPSYTVVDAPIVFNERGQPPWRPQNYDRQYRGPVTLREALEKSLNIPTIKIQEEVGTEKVIQVARAAGIETPIPQFRSIALGTAEVTLRDLTFAYAVFANQGIRVDPLFITRIEDQAGNLLHEWKPRRREVLPAAPVGVLVDMMQSVMNHGTGAPARTMGFELPAAGKSGTTDDYTDAWFVGFTPRVVCGVWVGYDQRKPIGHGMTGSQAALPIWAPLMTAATRGSAPEGFTLPEGVVIREVCAETGLIATPACPTKLPEEFLAGRVPTERCYLHGASFDLKLRDRWTDLRRKDWKKEKEEERQVKDPGRP